MAKKTLLGDDFLENMGGLLEDTQTKESRSEATKLDPPQKASDLIIKNPKASKARKIKPNLDLPTEFKDLFNIEVDLRIQKKASVLSPSNHAKLEKMAKMYDLKLNSLSNMIIELFFTENSSLLKKEISKRIDNDIF